MKKISISLFVTLLLSCLALTGCQQQADPATILAQMMKFCSEIKQTSFTGQFNLVGASPVGIFNGLNDLSINATGRVDLASIDSFRYSANLNVSGRSAEGSTKIGAEIRSLPDYSYFKVTDISMPLGLPFSLATDDKWYKIKKSNLAEGNTLGASNKSLSDSEIIKIRELTTTANLFTVTQVLPEEVVNNLTTYHFKAKINPDDLSNFFEGLTEITDSKVSLDIPYLVKLGEGSSFDLWVAKKNFSLVKLKIMSLNNAEADLPNFKLDLNFSKFNSPVDVKPPATVTSDFSLEKFFGISLNNL
jgi:hypothetical protein